MTSRFNISSFMDLTRTPRRPSLPGGRPQLSRTTGIPSEGDPWVYIHGIFMLDSERPAVDEACCNGKTWRSSRCVVAILDR